MALQPPWQVLHVLLSDVVTRVASLDEKCGSPLVVMATIAWTMERIGLDLLIKPSGAASRN